MVRWKRLSRVLDGKRIGHQVEELLFDKTFTIEDGIFGNLYCQFGFD